LGLAGLVFAPTLTSSWLTFLVLGVCVTLSCVTLVRGLRRRQRQIYGRITELDSASREVVVGQVEAIYVTDDGEFLGPVLRRLEAAREAVPAGPPAASGMELASVDGGSGRILREAGSAAAPSPVGHEDANDNPAGEAHGLPEPIARDVRGGMATWRARRASLPATWLVGICAGLLVLLAVAAREFRLPYLIAFAFVGWIAGSSLLTRLRLRRLQRRIEAGVAGLDAGARDATVRQLEAAYVTEDGEFLGPVLRRLEAGTRGPTCGR
jgi:hypothetical protein